MVPCWVWCNWLQFVAEEYNNVFGCFRPIKSLITPKNKEIKRLKRSNKIKKITITMKMVEMKVQFWNKNKIKKSFFAKLDHSHHTIDATAMSGLVSYLWTVSWPVMLYIPYSSWHRKSIVLHPNTWATWCIHLFFMNIILKYSLFNKGVCWSNTA